MIINTLLFKSYLTSNSDPAVTVFILGGIGAIFCLIGAIMHDRRKKLIKNGVQVEGIVVSVERERSSKDSMAFNYPVISYRTIQNELVTKKYNTGISPGSSYKEGDSVSVVYDPDNTSSFTLNDNSSKIMPLIFIFIGLALVIGAVVSYVIK